MTGIRDVEWKAVAAVTEGLKYWEAKGWICHGEAGVSEGRKIPEMQLEGQIQTSEETAVRSGGHCDEK